MENLGLNLGFLLIFALSFGILFVVLRAWVYKPILNLLDRRRTTIAQGLEDARVAAEARANAEREASKIVDEAQARAQEVIREAEERASLVAKEVRENAEKQATAERQKALADLDEERNRILSELRSQVATLAVAAAEKIIGSSLDENRQRALLDEFFSGIRSGQVTLMDRMDLTGQSAEVTSALPLTPEEQDVIKRELLSQPNGATITFRVDPAILGGLVVRVGDRVVDASVAGKLQNLRESLV